MFLITFVYSRAVDLHSFFADPVSGVFLIIFN